MSRPATAEPDIEVTLPPPILVPHSSNAVKPSAPTGALFLPSPHNLSYLKIPSHKLIVTPKESKRCLVLPTQVEKESDKNKHAETSRLRSLDIPIEAAEIVVYLHPQSHETDLSQTTITRTCRAALLTAGSLQLKRLSFWKTGRCCTHPNIKFSLFELRGVHMDSNVVVLAYKDQVFLYQTEEPSRFVQSIAAMTLAAYVGLPHWARPIALTGQLPAMPVIKPNDYKNWMGQDTGFSYSMYAAIIGQCVLHKIKRSSFSKEKTTPPSDTLGSIRSLIEKQQPFSILPNSAKAAKFIDIGLFAEEVTSLLALSNNKKLLLTCRQSLLQHALRSLAFNLVFRKLVLSNCQNMQCREMSEALCRTLLYNVTLREIDFSNTNLEGMGEQMGMALAMNAQPLISRICLSHCQLTDRDFRGLLPGLARIWCGGTALMEVFRIDDNLKISADTWDLFFETLGDPATFPFWPQRNPPPPPTLGYLQELDLRDTKAVGRGLIKFAAKLSGLRILKFSGNKELPRVLQALVAAEAPLEVFECNHGMTDVCTDPLMALGYSLKRVTLHDFKGDVMPLICLWPQAVPNLSLTLCGKLQAATCQAPRPNENFHGHTPGSLCIIEKKGYTHVGKQVVQKILSVRAGLKSLELDGLHYSQLTCAAPILAICGLESLHLHALVDSNFGKFPTSNEFWEIMAVSTTLRNLQLPGQLMGGPEEVGMIGSFLKRNRSVHKINFDSPFITLDVENVKILRSAFYGNKKVIELTYPIKAERATTRQQQRDSSEWIAEVQRSKAEIKRIFKKYYSKYNRNWRDKPNRLKLPYVERIRVAKRSIGRIQRDGAKIGRLFSEIERSIEANQAEQKAIQEVKSMTKLERRENQLKHLAKKKANFVTKLVTTIHKAKRRGRRKKGAKQQIPRTTYYKSRAAWPPKPSHSMSWQQSGPSSQYNYYNDPFHARYNPYFGYYAFRASHQKSNYLQGNMDEALEAEAVEEEAIYDNGAASEAPLENENEDVFSNMLVDVEDRGLDEHDATQDPWQEMGDLVSLANADSTLVTSGDYLSQIHAEAAELGLDVVADLTGALDAGMQLNDKMNDISESVGVPVSTVGAMVDSSTESRVDIDYLESTLGDMPDYQAERDADDAVAMYAAAGPRDLDDGGPAEGKSSHAALAGARRRAKCRKENRDMRRVRHRMDAKLQKGYRWCTWSPSRNPCTNNSVLEQSPWPDDVAAEWRETVKMKQIRAMTKSGLFQLPEACENEGSVLTEWSQDAVLYSSTMVVALVTQCSLDRLSNLEAQLTAWTGLASIAIYLKTLDCHDAAQQEILNCVERIRQNCHSKAKGSNIAITLVSACEVDEAYPINFLRNTALLQARYQHLRYNESLENSALFLVDVDFRPSWNLHSALHCSKTANIVLLEKRVIVCPAFECSKSQCPSSITELSDYRALGHVEPFHYANFPQGHGPTNFQKFWQESLESEYCLETAENLWDRVYAVEHETLFEPYVVMAAADVPLYDERFQGYGLNKVSHLESVSRMKNGSFFVLPGVFLVAPYHERSESWMKRYGAASDETTFNQLWLKGLYQEFKQRLEEGKGPVISRRTSSHNLLLQLQSKSQSKCQRPPHRSTTSHPTIHRPRDFQRIATAFV